MNLVSVLAHHCRQWTKSIWPKTLKMAELFFFFPLGPASKWSAGAPKYNRWERERERGLLSSDIQYCEHNGGHQLTVLKNSPVTRALCMDILHFPNCWVILACICRRQCTLPWQSALCLDYFRQSTFWLEYQSKCFGKVHFAKAIYCISNL